jgi:uncharacterized membrane protein SpoIIM required for sporulation
MLYLILIPLASFVFTKRIRGFLEARKTDDKKQQKIEIVLLCSTIIVVCFLVYIIEMIRR